MKVLYVTDGFDAAIQAGQLLEQIADRERVEVTVMSVTHAGVPAIQHLPLVLDPLPFRRDDSLAIVEAAAEKLRSAGFKRVHERTAEGHPGREIVRAVEDDSYDLTIMGAGGGSWLGDRLMGSVSTYVVHSSPTSVLVVHEGPIATDRMNVLVGTDGSEDAAFACETLAGLADPDRIKISVLSVTPPQSPLLFPALPGSTALPPGAFEQNEEVEKAMRERASVHANEAAARLRQAGFEVEARSVTGRPTEQLLKEAESERSDLVAVGSRGLGPVRRVLLGSVSDHIVRHSRAALVGRSLKG